MNHVVCNECDLLLDCDFMGLSIDEDDPCIDNEPHLPKTTKCDCNKQDR